jgi:site-specific DNA-methyltransferase (adenine-specific)
MQLRDTILFGNAPDILRRLPDNLVQCCVTSPPYWGGLRDYGTRRWFDGSTECAHDMAVVHSPHHAGQVPPSISRSPTRARAVADGHNAPTYSCSKCSAWYGELGLEPEVEQYVAHMVAIFREVRRVLRRDGTLWLNIGDAYKKKQLTLVPSRLARALQDDGWYLRNEIIWEKTNGLPESVRDRPSRSHEHVLYLSKSKNCFYDGAAPQRGKNLRSVWRVPTSAYRGAHYATMPEALVEPCILAGTSERGACQACGAPWRRRAPNGVTTGWVPTCRCECPETLPCIVLDPFAGSGTVLSVAKRLWRDYLGIELNDRNCRLISARVCRAHQIAEARNP